MSRSIGVVAGAATSLQALASGILGKATGNTVSLAAGASDVALGLGGASAAPKDAHTSVLKAAPAKGVYAGVNVTFVRSVLPTADGAALPLREAVDAFAAAGINASAEIAAAKAAASRTAKVAVEAAKANGGKLTVVVKQQSKFEQVNKVFAEAVAEAAEGKGVAVEYVDSATATNQLIMFPENYKVVATADTAAADNLELALSGLYGASRTYQRASGSSVAAGHSAATIAAAVSSALANIGLTAEAKKATA